VSNQEEMINFDPHTTDSSMLREERNSKLIENNPAPKLLPMSPLAASATIINLLLATGPFSYPYAYTSLGPVLSAPLLFVVSILAYITATYLVEAVSIATALGDGKTDRRTESLFDSICYKTPIIERKFNDADASIKESEFYIREKIELGILA